ncbi:MAG TPA: hypothetical protein VNR18_01010 [Hyphomicrobiales bacterium]|nr:hypothetical protein [Hyphomicrobiales bacterium]
MVQSRTAALLRRLTLAVALTGLLAYWLTAAVARLLPLPRADAAILPTLLAFPLAVVLLLWLMATGPSRRRTLVLALLGAAAFCLSRYPQCA